ncbi:MAG: signaling protein consisting of a modified GGDEF domain and a DHH domain protein, partial [Eubacterium sp.]|nr:signaling protein consisting of a modified GGDEF domain and a DHH domain protein [Eubacterium sp.]
MNKEKQLKRRIEYIIIIPILLALTLLLFTIYENGLDSRIGTISVALLVVYIAVVIILYLRLIPSIGSVLVDYSLEQGKVQKELLHELEIPYAILDTSGHVMWANNMFHDILGVSQDKRIKKTVDSYFPEISTDLVDEVDSIDVGIEYEDRKYRVTLRRMDLSNVFEEDKDQKKDDDIVIAMYLFDETELRRYEQENAEQKLYAGLIYLDNYDEVMDSLEDLKHSILTALVERKINMYLSNIDAIVKHTENDKYFFVFKQKYIQTLREDKFSLLDEVKSINVGNDISMTLSIGIGGDSDPVQNSFMNAYDNARTAIGMAMGRGGDQAAIKYGDQVTYFGGKSAGTEKATRVKARVKAQAFEELLLSKDKVLIMAHKRPDADAFGSAIGIYRMVTSLGKKAYIVINEVTDAIKPLYNSFKVGNFYDGVFLTSTEAVSQVNQNTVVVVCDVNRPSMTECEELLSLVPTV